LPIQIFIRNLLFLQAGFDQCQHFHETGKNQDFVIPRLFLDIFQQRIEFHRFVAIIGIIQQGRAVANLAQAGQAFQNIHL